ERILIQSPAMSLLLRSPQGLDEPADPAARAERVLDALDEDLERAVVLDDRGHQPIERDDGERDALGVLELEEPADHLHDAPLLLLAVGYRNRRAASPCCWKGSRSQPGVIGLCCDLLCMGDRSRASPPFRSQRLRGSMGVGSIVFSTRSSSAARRPRRSVALRRALPRALAS